jgi:hypothetical protein
MSDWRKRMGVRRGIVFAVVFMTGCASGLFAEEAAPAAADESLDVTITGEAKDEIPLTKPEPPLDIPFDRIAELSREGQTDRVLTGPVEHMTGAEQMSLLQMDSRQTSLGLPVRIPAAPFIRMELSPGLSPASWEFQVLDQNDRIIKAKEGVELPKYVMDWDGFLDGAFRLRPGVAYTPVLVATDARKKTVRFFGEPVRFSAMQYIQSGVFRIEFDNASLFERGRAALSSDMTALLQASEDVLRLRAGRPIRVVLFSVPGGAALAQKRLDALKAFYKEGLALEDDMITFVIEPVKDRGEVTEISVKDQ